MKTVLNFLFILICSLTFGQKNKLIPTQKGKEWFYCDSTGKITLKGKWEYATSFHNGFAYVCNNKRSGCIDSTGKFESNCNYKEMGRFYKGYTWASNKWDEIKIINKNCEVKFQKKHNYSEHAAAFFDSIIIIYALNKAPCSCDSGSFGAVDYDFKPIIPFYYANILQSSSSRYYFVARESCSSSERLGCLSLWGIYDIEKKEEVVKCKYKGSLSGTGSSDIHQSTYSLDIPESFCEEMKKHNITLPARDEISDQINGFYSW